MKKSSGIGLAYKGKKIIINARKCSPIMEAVGLMFSRREKAEALLFDFSGRGEYMLHSFFVFFPFLAVWLDGKNRISEIMVVMPFSFGIKPKKRFSKIVEIPINRRYKEIIKKLVGKRKV